MAIIDRNKIGKNILSDFEIDDYKIEIENREDIRVVFMGTPSFAVPVLKSLINKYNVVLVVCQPDKEKDRKGNIIFPMTKSLALEYGIEVFQPTKLRVDYQKIIEMEPDIIITCAYGQILPKELLDYPKYGCINVHGSLLPKLRGGAPIHWAIINGEEETGITIMDMSEEMDAGDIISQAKIKITDDMILDTLYEEMSLLGSRLLMETIPFIIDGTAKRTVQDDNKKTFGLNVRKEETRIDFGKSSREIFNLVRGLNSNPAAFTILDGKRIKIYEVEVIKRKNDSLEYGKIVDIDKTGIIVSCKDGMVKILDLQVEGKKRCKACDYLNGVKKEELIGKVFEA